MEEGLRSHLVTLLSLISHRFTIILTLLKNLDRFGWKMCFPRLFHPNLSTTFNIWWRGWKISFVGSIKSCILSLSKSIWLKVPLFQDATIKKYYLIDRDLFNQLLDLARLMKWRSRIRRIYKLLQQWLLSHLSQCVSLNMMFGTSKRPKKTSSWTSLMKRRKVKWKQECEKSINDKMTL